MTTFLLIRHGLTDAVNHYLAGVAPGIRLNGVGRTQVARLVERLHDIPLTAIVSSPLERTRETADAIGRDHGLAVQTAPAFLGSEVRGRPRSVPTNDPDGTQRPRRPLRSTFFLCVLCVLCVLCGLCVQ